MTLHRLSILWLTAVLVVAGCNTFRRQGQSKVPPVFVPAPAAEPAVPPGPKAVDYPTPPELQPDVSSDENAPLVVEQEIAVAPPPQVPIAREPAKPESPPAAQQPAAPVQVPQLTQLLTPEEEKRYNEEIDDGLARVRKNLEILAGRSLNDEQQGILERINAFVQQTSETRKGDLVTAKALAQRADLLSRDLERTTR
jgi:hypothetical protein